MKLFQQSKYEICQTLLGPSKSCFAKSQCVFIHSLRFKQFLDITIVFLAFLFMFPSFKFPSFKNPSSVRLVPEIGLGKILELRFPFKPLPW